MAIRDIVFVPDPVLRLKAKKVTNFDDSFNQLIDDMLDTMREAPGVGLAAPQVGIPQQIVVIEYGSEDDDSVPSKVFVLANPEIVKYSDEKVMGIEGCLSVPGLAGEVERANSVVVKSLNRYGKPQKHKVSGWLARIFQHEIDHLEGIIYTDRAEKVWQPDESEELADV